MSPGQRPARGPQLGHALLFLSAGALTYAARLPGLRREALERSVAEANADVRVLRAAAERFRLQQGHWPDGNAPGATPAELILELPRSFDPLHDGYAVQWTRLERLVQETLQSPIPAAGPGAVRPTALPSRPIASISEFGAISIVSGNISLLAALYRDHGPAVSFVTDSTWTLLVPDAIRR
jgi:hypothetical protein